MFDQTLGPLLSHIRANNKLEIRTLREASHLAATAVYYLVRSRIKDVGKISTLQEKIEHNDDSVSWLRTRYIKTINKISESDFGYHG